MKHIKHTIAKWKTLKSINKQLSICLGIWILLCLLFTPFWNHPLHKDHVGEQNSKQHKRELHPTNQIDPVAIIRWQQTVSLEEKLAALKQHNGWTPFAPKKLDFRKWHKINLVCYYNSNTDVKFLTDFLNQLPNLPDYDYHIELVDLANLPQYKIDAEHLAATPVVRIQVDTKNIADIRNLSELNTALNDYCRKELDAYWAETDGAAIKSFQSPISTEPSTTSKLIKKRIAYKDLKPNHSYRIVSTLYVYGYKNQQQMPYTLSEDVHTFIPTKSTGTTVIHHSYHPDLLEKLKTNHPDVQFPKDIECFMAYELQL